MNGDREKKLEELLHEGLNLCVRARKMDSMDRRRAALDFSQDGKAWEASGEFAAHVEGHNTTRPDAPIHPRSATVHLWMQEQYDADLAEWERKARAALNEVAA